MVSEALKFAAELKDDLAELKLETVEGVTSVSCSFGVSEFRPGDTADEVMKRADVALYRAKAAGRNCVVKAEKNNQTKRANEASRYRERARTSTEFRDRRHGHPACEGLLARVCAVVHLLVASGLSEEIATQTMAQRMVSAGIPFPKNAQCERWGDYLAA
jgi:hypothetical protein